MLLARRVLSVLLILLYTAYASERRQPTSVLRRAMQSAAQRAAQKDSLCHGAHQNEVSADTYMSFAKRHASAADEHDEHSLHTLYKWCLADEQCASSYYLHDADADLDMFRYLTSQWHDAQYPLTQLLDEGGLCGSEPTLAARATHASAASVVANETRENFVLDRMLRRAWVLEMRLQSCQRASVQCAENQKFIFSPQDGEGRCVCAATDDDCHVAYRRQHLSPWTYSTTALVVSSVAVTVLIVLEIYRLCLQIPTFRALYAQAVRQQKQAPKSETKEAPVKTFIDALRSESKNK